MSSDTKKLLRYTIMRPPETLGLERESKRVVTGGHMQYERYIDMTSTEPRFVKQHHANAFTDARKEQHSREYLEKEYHMYQHLAEHAFQAIPFDVMFEHAALSMEAFRPEDNWQWHAPNGDQRVQYIDVILATLHSLESIALPPDLYDSEKPSSISHIEEGWEALEKYSVDDISRHILQGASLARVDFRPVFHDFAEAIPSLISTWRDAIIPESPSVFSHHDARQANIAWHPEHGVRVVDWSWAGYGLERADTTTFLIDLHKSGVDISSYMNNYSNSTHTLLQAGFLLGHSLWPASPSSKTVRAHQLISAASAFDIWRNA
jgi:thiamine kinase-like enzyme